MKLSHLVLKTRCNNTGNEIEKPGHLDRRSAESWTGSATGGQTERGREDGKPLPPFILPPSFFQPLTVTDKRRPCCTPSPVVSLSHNIELWDSKTGGTPPPSAATTPGHRDHGRSGSARPRFTVSNREFFWSTSSATPFRHPIFPSAGFPLIPSFCSHQQHVSSSRRNPSYVTIQFSSFARDNNVLTKEVITSPFVNSPFNKPRFYDTLFRVMFMDTKRDLWSAAYRFYQEQCREIESTGDLGEYFLKLAGKIGERCLGEDAEGAEMWKGVYGMLEARARIISEQR